MESKRSDDLRTALALVLDLIGQDAAERRKEETAPETVKPEPAGGTVQSVKKPEGWYLNTRVREDGKVHVYLMKDGVQVSSGFSQQREDLSEGLAMAQAFSYAAHMCFKHMQWREEFPDAEQG